MSATAGALDKYYLETYDGITFIADAVQAVNGAGTNTAAVATVSTPTYVSGTAQQPSTTQDAMVYIAVKTSASLTVAIGSTSSTTTNIVPAESVALGLVSVRVPAGWYLKITGTISDLQVTQVLC